MATSLRNNKTLLTRTWHVNIRLPYGVVFPIGSVRCVACKYRASVPFCFSYGFGAGCFSYRPIGSVRAPHRADRKNNTVQKPDIYIPRTAPKRQEKQHRTEARYLHSTYVSKIYCYFSTKYNNDHHMLETHLSVKLAHAQPRGPRGREDFDWLLR